MTNTKRFFHIPAILVLGLLILVFITPFSTMGQASRDLESINELRSLSKGNLGDFTWMNEPGQYTLSEGLLAITAEQGTDFFVNPEDELSVATAPYLYREVKGDFVAIARVKPDFTSIWNACSLLVHLDEENWIKFAFENSDATGPGIVSVVTRGVSDDANGPVFSDQKTLCLKLIRKDAIFALHWSTDGITYHLARLAAMPNQDMVKVGMEAQCPAEGPAKHVFSHFSLESKTVNDLRKGL